MIAPGEGAEPCKDKAMLNELSMHTLCTSTGKERIVVWGRTKNNEMQTETKNIIKAEC